MSACERCGGTGVQKYRTLGDVEPRDIGDGMTVQDMGGWGTRACACVRDLPPILDEPSWWEIETLHSEVVGVPIGCEAVEVTADCEVPRRADGRRVHRTAGNAYYPPLIVVEAPARMTLHSDTAREVAAALIAAADACDAADFRAMVLSTVLGDNGPSDATAPDDF